MAALSFCTTARSSAMVFEARTLRMNCFTVLVSVQAGKVVDIGCAQELIAAAWTSGSRKWMKVRLRANAEGGIWSK
jgi:hypothetical protein